MSPVDSPVCCMNFFWSALMAVSTLTVAFCGFVSDTYVRLCDGLCEVAARRAALDNERAEDDGREQLLRTCLAAEGAILDIVVVV